MQLLYLLMDLFSIFLFLACLYDSRNYGDWVILLFLALIYGLTLEIVNVKLSGFYRYSTSFPLRVRGIPLSVAIGWATIIYSSMRLTDKFKMPLSFKPLSDAYHALLIDLSMDVVAIRLGYWSWAIPLSSGWFGVPAGNYIGWFLVVTIYSTIVRKSLSNASWIGRLIFLSSPASSLSLLISFLYLLGRLGIMGASTAGYLFFLSLFIISGLTTMRWDKNGNSDLTIPLAIRGLFQIYFISLYLYTGMYHSIPRYTIVLLSLFLLEIAQWIRLVRPNWKIIQV